MCDIFERIVPCAFLAGSNSFLVHTSYKRRFTAFMTRFLFTYTFTQLPLWFFAWLIHSGPVAIRQYLARCELCDMSTRG